eukprot:s2693_g7.t1
MFPWVSTNQQNTPCIPKELLALEDKEQSKGKKGGQVGQVALEPTTGTKERRKRQRQRKKEAAKEASAELHAAENGGEEGMDDIDMEFKQRVLEHLRIRAEEAKKSGGQPQTDRGNAILKALCTKLKAQLESVDDDRPESGGKSF